MSFVKSNQSEPLECLHFKPEFLSGHEVFRLAHLSDLHIFSSHNVRLRDLLNKRLYGYLSWRLHRRHEHSDRVLLSLLEDMRSARPDHIVITGDLTHLGLPREFVAAGELLRSIGPPSKVTVIPGNHDTYIASAWEDTFRLWLEYMVSDTGCRAFPGAEKGFYSVFPSLRVRGDVALIGLSTAIPTPPFFAFGSIGRVQMKKFEEILIETGRRKLFRIVLIHHPPIPGAISKRKRLTDRAAFQAVLARQGAELVLYGHTHRTSSGYLETPPGRILSIGVPSASAIGRTVERRAAYHIFRLIRNVDRWELFLYVRVYSLRKRCFVYKGTSRITLPQQIGS